MSDPQALTTPALMEAFRAGRFVGQRGPITPHACVLTRRSLLLFTAGGTVLKLRRPRRLPDTDQRTRTLRTFWAEQELWIGRRAAPHVYLTDCALHWDGDSYTVVPGILRGEPLVAMRRLADEVRADRLVAEGAADVEALRPALAMVAAFHEASPVHRVHEGIGRPERTGERWREVLAALAAHPAAPIAPEERARLAEETEEWLEACHGHLEHRVTEGRIRQVHGDLRLEHLYLEDPVALIDPAQAPTDFHWMDTGEELGLLAMELRALGRRDLADAALDVYAGLTLDRTLRYVAPIFERLQALRRALTCLMEAEQEPAEITRERARFFVELALAPR